MTPASVRPLTAQEREVLRAVVLSAVRQDALSVRAALLAQVDAAQVIGPSCPCGCASLAVAVDRSAAPPVALPRLEADAVVDDETVGFIVWLDDGYLVDVEIFGYGDADDSVWPPATLIR